MNTLVKRKLFDTLSKMESFENIPAKNASYVCQNWENHWSCDLFQACAKLRFEFHSRHLRLDKRHRLKKILSTFVPVSMKAQLLKSYSCCPEDVSFDWLLNSQVALVLRLIS